MLIQLLICMIFAQVGAELAVMDVKSGSDTKSFCILYNPAFNTLPSVREESSYTPVVDLTPSMFCESPTVDPGIKDSVVLVNRGNCTFVQKAKLAQTLGAQALVAVSSSGLITPGGGSAADYQAVNITVATMSSEDHDTMQGLGDNLSVVLYSPAMSKIDYNLVVIWLLAVVTVVLGGLWSGRTSFKLHNLKQRGVDGGESGESPSDTDSLDLSVKTIVIFVAFMCAMILALYFLYDYLVYVIIAIFVLASSFALYSVLALFLPYLRFIPDCTIALDKLPCVGAPVEVRRIVLLALCYAVGVWWAVERHQWYAWILQDILGVTFCINTMKLIRLPSFKVCTVLMSILLIYDVFFVFITPYFTKSGESVMVDVATGGSGHSGEQLPMVLVVPKIAASALNVCQLPYSLLGFGDILLPGLLIGYNYGFDLIYKTGRVYFISSVIAYGVGLVVTFVAMAMMETGQPALLYLVPCTLIVTFIVALKRKEVKKLWNGQFTESRKPSEEQRGDVVQSPSRDEDVVRSRAVSRENSMESVTAHSDNEQRHLLTHKTS